jgi:exodeoxyribonuclease VII small subunit
LLNKVTKFDYFAGHFASKTALQ